MVVTIEGFHCILTRTLNYCGRIARVDSLRQTINTEGGYNNYYVLVHSMLVNTGRNQLQHPQAHSAEYGPGDKAV